jgi:hypothetical protein
MFFIATFTLVITGCNLNINSCPQSCDDNNECTQEFCNENSDLKCVYSNISNCIQNESDSNNDVLPFYNIPMAYGGSQNKNISKIFLDNNYTNTKYGFIVYLPKKWHMTKSSYTGAYFLREDNIGNISGISIKATPTIYINQESMNKEVTLDFLRDYWSDTSNARSLSGNKDYSLQLLSVYTDEINTKSGKIPTHHVVTIPKLIGSKNSYWTIMTNSFDIVKPNESLLLRIQIQISTQKPDGSNYTEQQYTVMDQEIDEILYNLEFIPKEQ